MPDNTSPTVSFQPAVTKRASEIIFDQIKDMILRGELQPGNRLPSEKNLMDMFGRSRPTIREALRMLEREGYIRAIAGSSGAVVLAPDSTTISQSIAEALQIGRIDLAEMSEYRRISEAATVTWACERRTEEDIRTLREYLNKMAEHLNDASTFSSMDPKFHGLIAAAGKNSVSVLMSQTLSSTNQNFFLVSLAKIAPSSAAEQAVMLQRVHEQHEAIFEAIRDGDAQAGRAAMEKHLNSFLDDLR